MSSLIRVLVADDHTVVRKALRSLLTAKYGIEVVGEAADGIEAIEKARALKPDVILMDLVMPRKGGLEATQEILSEDPGARILILTSFNDEDQIVSAVKAGAVGYVLKDTSPDELVHAIRGAYMGKLSLPAHMLHLVIPESPPDQEQKDA
jgi:NarL family two-component system response regulator LiaR